MSLCTYETRNISLADMLVRALPLVSPTSETLIAARLGSCPEEQASRFVVGSLERPGPAARAPEGCHISRRAAAAAWPVHPKGRPSARRRQLGRPRVLQVFIFLLPDIFETTKICSMIRATGEGATRAPACTHALRARTRARAPLFRFFPLKLIQASTFHYF